MGKVAVLLNSGYLLYSIVPIVHNMVLFTSKFVKSKSHVKCSYFKRKKGTLGAIGCVCYLHW